jgi:hypothetical protein
MSMDRIYARLREPLAVIAEDAVDEQTDLAERVSLMEAIEGSKPSFVAFLEMRRRYPGFAALEEAVGDAAMHGKVNADVHHRYRPYKVDDPEFAAVLDARGTYRQDVFWVTRDHALAEAYRSGSPSREPDDVLLGYPPCCGSWHYDVFFARGVEAFCAVAKVEVREEMLGHLREDWEPMSGFYLPEQIYLAAILRSNWRYPHVDHMACPSCIGDPASQSAQMNARRSALGAALEPALHAAVERWAAGQERRWRELLDRSAPAIRQASARVCETVRGADVYARHAKFLVKAILG